MGVAAFDVIDEALEAKDRVQDANGEMDEMDKTDEEDTVAARVVSHGRAGRWVVEYGDDDEQMGALWVFYFTNTIILTVLEKSLNVIFLFKVSKIHYKKEI